jgi:hypothetical protein
MNIIQRQADDFFRRQGAVRFNRKCKEIIDDVRLTLYDYNKDSYKIQFLERLKYLYKDSYDQHLSGCTAVIKSDCPTNQIHEDILFFLQEELEIYDNSLDNAEFSLKDKEQANEAFERLLYEINLIKLGQEITYEDLSNEIEDLRNFYFLNKKNWTEMFIGKLSQMVASGIIGETVSKEIVNFIRDNYPRLIT